MKQHAKIQVGNTILDGEIDIENKIPENPEPEVVQLFRAFMGQFPTWPVTNGFNEAPVIEGSIVEPITDEKRLLSSPHPIARS